MMFDSIIDQEKPVARLLAMFFNQTVPHALLLTGIEGIGKSSAATAFSMVLNCHGSTPDTKNTEMLLTDFYSTACRECLSCKKIQSGNHPDIIHVKPLGNFIKIAQIRELCSTLLSKPYEAKKRVVIISDAGTMNPEAGNALLKVLEEPPSNTVFILTASQPSDLLPTILSRCQHIGFNPIAHATIVSWLIKHHNSPHEQANIIASLANGSLKKARELSEKSSNRHQWINKRNWIANEVNNLYKGSATACLLFAEKMASKKESVSDTLEMLLIIIRDLIIYKFSPDKLINRDMTETITAISNNFSVKSLLTITEHIQTAQKSIKANTSLRLTLEVLAIKIARV